MVDHSHAEQSGPAVFAGHSGFIAALAGLTYDIQAAAAGVTPVSVAPERRIADDTGLTGGLVEVFAPPLEPPRYERTATGFEVEYPPALERCHALTHTIAGVSALLRLRRRPDARVRLVRSVADVRQARAGGMLAAVLHLADADAIDEPLDALPVLYEAGVRSLAITWSRANAFGYGAPYRSPATPDIGPGLTAAGIRLVSACNDLGVMIDLAHLNEAGFWDVARHSTAPLVVTHGAAHALSPTSRALTDRQLAAISASGGVVGVSLEGPEVHPSHRVTAMVQQIEYLLERMGVDGVALGSDLYQKPSAEHPGGRSLVPELLEALRVAGFDCDTISRIAADNWMRVLERSWS
jgi:membrane dipeptidase